MRWLRSIASILGIFPVVLAGCAGGETEGSGTGTTTESDPCAAGRTSPECLKALDAACEEREAAICEAIFQCEPLVAPVRYGTVSICSEKSAERCKNLMRLPDVSDTPETLRECAEKFVDYNCGGTFQEACFPKGASGLGEQCTVNGQCESRRCIWASGADCGTCGLWKQEGEVCSVTYQDCAPGLTCLAVTKTCGKQLPLGAGCGDRDDCDGPLVCLSGKCSNPLGEGQVCAESVCDTQQLLACDGAKCVKFEVVGAGQSCTFAVCAYGSECDSNEVCALQPGEGEPCGSLGCPSPYGCRGGVCTLEYVECK